MATVTMFEPSRNDEYLLGRIAHSWISYMAGGRNSDAIGLLANDCGFLGFDLNPHSIVYIPIRAIRSLPRLTARRIFASDNEVSLHVELLQPIFNNNLYRIYFRFRFARISKVHFSSMADGMTYHLDHPQFELPLQEVVFLWG